jgi:hypothetical protein
MSRKSGDLFEYSITHHLITVYNLKFTDDYSKDKFANWRSRLQVRYFDLPFIDEFTMYDKIRLCRDTEGHAGDSSDVELHSDRELLPISFKNNNISIKHPRAGSIQDHLIKQTMYKQKYNDINDKYYKLFTDSAISTFKSIPAELKLKMYNDFTSLLVGILSTDPLSCRSLFQFCIGIRCRHQLIIKNEKNKVNIFKYKPVNFNKAQIKRLSENSFKLTVGKTTIKFRIHNASSRITPNLSLKYDVTPDNVNDLFDELTFE